MNKTNTRKTVNVALVGLGFMGIEHSKAWSLAPVICPDIAATPVKKIVCDVNAKVAEEKAKLWGYEEWCTDWHELLDRDDIDIVDLCTPPALHTEMAVEFFKKGKFVFCEKPLTTTVADCEKLIEGQKKYNGRSATAFNKRRWPAVTYARQLVAEGAIGKPLVVNVRYNQGGGKDAETPGPASFRDTWLIGGGIADSGSHIIDMARYILNDSYEDIVGITENLVDKAVKTNPDGTKEFVKRDAEDQAMAILNTKGGVTVTLLRLGKYLGSGEDISFEVLGTKGTMRWSGANPTVFEFFQTGSDPSVKGFKSILMGPVHPYGKCTPRIAGFGVGCADCYSFQAYEVVQACVNGTKYDPDFCDALEVVKVAEALRESNNTKKWVKIN